MRGTRAWPPTGLIPWFSKTEGNTYATLLHHPFLFKGKPTQCSRGSKKDFWRHCRGDLRQVKTYQVPIITLILRITLFPICLSFSSPPLHPCRFIRPPFLLPSFSVPLLFSNFPLLHVSCFPLPHFTLAVLFALFSFHPLFPFPSSFPVCLFCLFLVCLCVGLLARHDGSR